MSDEEAQAAKDKLHAAIRDYHATIDSDVYVDAWCLITHKLSIDLEAANASEVSHLVPTGQPWPLTVGLLRIVTNAEERPEMNDAHL